MANSPATSTPALLPSPPTQHSTTQPPASTMEDDNNSTTERRPETPSSNMFDESMDYTFEPHQLDAPMFTTDNLTNSTASEGSSTTSLPIRRDTRTNTTHQDLEEGEIMEEDDVDWGDTDLSDCETISDIDDNTPAPKTPTPPPRPASPVYFTPDYRLLQRWLHNHISTPNYLNTKVWHHNDFREALKYAIKYLQRKLYVELWNVMQQAGEARYNVSLDPAEMLEGRRVWMEMFTAARVDEFDDAAMLKEYLRDVRAEIAWSKDARRRLFMHMRVAATLMDDPEARRSSFSHHPSPRSYFYD